MPETVCTMVVMRRAGERSGDFDGALFGGALNFLDALGMGHGLTCQMSERMSRASVTRRVEIRDSAARRGDGLFVDGAVAGSKKKRFGRDVGLRAVEADVTLALLLGIVKRMGVEEGATNWRGYFPGRIRNGRGWKRVMSAVKGGGADVEALFVGDFLRGR